MREYGCHNPMLYFLIPCHAYLGAYFPTPHMYFGLINLKGKVHLNKTCVFLSKCTF